MRTRKGAAVICTFAVTGAFLLMSTSVMAEEADTISIPYMQDGAWNQIAMTNDDTVSTGINIRSAANSDSEVIGYMYSGGAAWVINKGEEWTEIYSGGLTGFVRNEYLVYGDEVKGLADYYGVEGVSTTWDDVKLFGSEGNAADVIGSVDSGSSMILLQDNGHWKQVQSGADNLAYVSEDDVTPVLMLNTAVAKDALYEPLASGAYEESWDEPVYEETYTDSSEPEQTYEDAYTEPAYTETEAYVEPTYTETEAYVEPTYTETEAYVEPTYTETEAYVEPTYTETEAYVEPTYTETEAPQTEASDNGGYGYYDADTGIYYDANGNAIDSGYDAQQTEAYLETEAYVEPTYTETEAYVETEVPAETEAPAEPASSGTDDTSLLAALIYCEAGNQSYEGMVAVGAVVMNRVYSPSFPNSISEVIYQSGQFTPASSGSLASALSSGVPSTCYDAAAAAISGENPVGSALYFNTGSGKGTKIGDHQFY